VTPATNKDLLDELRGVKDAVRESNRVLAGKANRWSVRAIGVSVILSLAVGIGGILYAVDQNHDSCVDANAARADIRAMSTNIMIESSEALIAIATDAESTQVDAFRAETHRRADEIVSRLPDREC
jgi:hypothetical protein